MEGLPSVPGVVVTRSSGRPATWRGRVGGDEVDVIVLEVGPDPELRRAALAAVAPLTQVGARSVTLCRDGVAVICPTLSGTPLDALPPLEPGHAVFVGSSVAQVFSRLHERGLAWGGDLSELLVAGDGSVLMPLHGLAARRVAGERPSAEDDVTALRALLARRCPDLSPLPGDLAGLRRRLRRAARPRRLVLAGSEPPTRLRWWWLALLPVAVAGAAVAGWMSVRPASPRTDVVPARASGGLPAWTAVVDRLDRARAAALAGTGPLSAADAPGSPALLADSRTAAALRARAPGTVPPVPVVAAVAVVRAGPTTMLRVTDSLPAYVYRDGAGRPLGSVPARGPRTWTVTVVRTAAGWRVRQVS